MDLALDDIAAASARAARDLGAHVSGDVVARDAAAEFSREGWKELAAGGLTGLSIPIRYGGRGATAVTAVATLAALGETCTDNGLLFAMGAHLWACADPIARCGSEAQKQKWLPGLCDGSLIGAHAASEKDAGSDAAAIRTTARRVGGQWRLDGAKMFVTNAPHADLFLVTAVTDPDQGTMGISMFLVPRTTAGLSVGEPISKSGLRTAAMAEVTLQGCVVGDEALLGPAGAGMGIFTSTMTRERSFILAPAVGTLTRLVERCFTYARQRRQFGTAIADFQAVSHSIADMRMRAETARLLAFQVGWLTDRQRVRPHDAAMVKLHLSEALLASALDAVRIHGGYGYAAELGLERMVRDAMGAALYSGTSDIQRNLIARARIVGPAVSGGATEA